MSDDMSRYKKSNLDRCEALNVAFAYKSLNWKQIYCVIFLFLNIEKKKINITQEVRFQDIKHLSRENTIYETKISTVFL